MKPVITLISDFGNSDYRMAVIKGKIFSGNENATVVDITHEIPANSIEQTAYVLQRGYHHFPKGSVHIVMVDSFYHPQRKNLICQLNGHYFIAADNGVLSLLHPEFKVEDVYEITYNNRFDDVVENVSTDIFVPAALHLLRGGLPEVIGKKIYSIVQRTYLKEVVREKMIVGEVVYIDGHGNLVTNLSRQKFEEMQRIYSNYTVRFRNFQFSKIMKSFSELITDWEEEPQYHGKYLALFNEMNYLELMIYKGSIDNGANKLFGMKEGETVFIEFQ